MRFPQRPWTDSQRPGGCNGTPCAIEVHTQAHSPHVSAYPASHHPPTPDGKEDAPEILKLATPFRSKPSPAARHASMPHTKCLGFVETPHTNPVPSRAPSPGSLNESPSTPPCASQSHPSNRAALAALASQTPPTTALEIPGRCVASLGRLPPNTSSHLALRSRCPVLGVLV